MEPSPILSPSPSPSPSWPLSWFPLSFHCCVPGFVKSSPVAYVFLWTLHVHLVLDGMLCCVTWVVFFVIMGSLWWVWFLPCLFAISCFFVLYSLDHMPHHWNVRTLIAWTPHTSSSHTVLEPHISQWWGGWLDAQWTELLMLCMQLTLDVVFATKNDLVCRE